MTTCDCHECIMKGDSQVIKQWTLTELIMSDIFLLLMVATNLG